MSLGTFPLSYFGREKENLESFPSARALELLDVMDREEPASRWDLIKVVGNTAQFRQWMDNFLIADGLVEEITLEESVGYTKTERGDLFHQLLRNGNIMRSFLRVSGKRLSSK